jgi:hypothetical protein
MPLVGLDTVLCVFGSAIVLVSSNADWFYNFSPQAQQAKSTLLFAVHV